jgi:cell division protein FtsW (lipid II flippase)
VLLGFIVPGATAIALHCRHQCGRLRGLGIAMNCFICVFANSTTVMGAIPACGVPLPLASQEGSPMSKVMIGLELLMSAHAQRDVEFEQEREAL